MNIRLNFVGLCVIFPTVILNTPAAEYGGGSGTPEDPYQIRTAEQMNTIGLNPSDWDKHFILTADLDMSAYTGTQYNIIGHPSQPFTGTLNGNHHSIRNLTINRIDRGGIGLLGVIDKGGKVKNLSLVNVSICGRELVGGLAGYLIDGQIESCRVTGTVSAWGWRVGGLVGENYGTISFSETEVIVSSPDSYYTGGLAGFHGCGTIRFCRAKGNVTGKDYLGGLTGANEGGGCIFFSSFTGTVTSTGGHGIGGLTGVNWGLLADSYACASVQAIGSFDVGGLVGINETTVNNCYACGTVAGDWGVGGLIGYTYGGLFSASFWDIETSGLTDGVGDLEPDPNGVIGKTTAEMQTLSTFISAGWDVTNETENGTSDIWRMCTDGVDYPRLNWEFVSGDFACPDGVYLEDLAFSIDRWLMSGCSSSDNFCGGADLNHSGFVDLADWVILAQNWLRE